MESTWTYILLRRGPHSPCMCRNRCWYRWVSGNGPRTQLPHTGAGCPLSGTVGRWFLPDPAPELPRVLFLTAANTQRSERTLDESAKNLEWGMNAIHGESQAVHMFAVRGGASDMSGVLIPIGCHGSKHEVFCVTTGIGCAAFLTVIPRWGSQEATLTWLDWF